MKKTRKVAIFPPNTVSTKVIERNGIALDDICYTCTVDEDISTGSYFLDGVFLIDKNRQLYKKIKEESIIKVTLDYGEEIFKINYVKRSTRTITIVARQITIPATLSLWFNYIKAINCNGLVSLDYLLRSAIGKKEISVYSNIEKMGDIEYKKKNLYEVLHTTKDSFEDIYGGEVQRRGYQLRILTKIGSDRGVTIRSRKNLKGYEDEVDIDKLCTRAIGVGYDGIEGSYIDSPKINDYEDIYTRVFTYNDIKVKGENDEEGFATLEEAKAELDKRVDNEFTINKVDELKTQYKLSFLELEKTEEGKEFTPATKVYPGDTVTVDQDTLGIKIKVRAIRRKFNVMTQKVIETELSNLPLSSYQKPPTISDILDKLDKLEDENSNFLDLAKDNATALINAGLKNSYVIVRSNEIIIGDTKDINTMTKLYRWNVNGLGHSKTGYYGKYEQAMTSDGAIVADFITTGILNANLIRTGILKSFNNKTWINMEDGTFNFADKMKYDGRELSLEGKLQTTFMGNKSITVANDGIEFFGSYTEKDKKISAINVGTVMSGIPADNYSSISWNLWYGSDFGITIWDNDTNGREYLSFSPKSQDKITFGPRALFVDGANFKDSAKLLDYNSTKYYGSDIVNEIGRVSAGHGNDLWISARQNIGAVILGEIFDNGAQSAIAKFKPSGSVVYSDFAVTGTKLRAVTTEFGVIGQNAYETASPYFGDIGEGTIGDDGLCYIFIDPIMDATINTKCSYQVFVQAYGYCEGTCKPAERNEDHFIVAGTPGLKFAWELKGHQKGYENDRLEILDPLSQTDYISGMEEFSDEINYEENANEYLLNYERELFIDG